MKIQINIFKEIQNGDEAQVFYNSIKQAIGEGAEISAIITNEVV